MANNAYNIGDLVTLTATFSEAGAAVAPTTVVCRVKDPAGTITTPAVSNPSVGIYTAAVPVALAGDWYYRFEGTGTHQKAGESTFAVRPSVFPAD